MAEVTSEWGRVDSSGHVEVRLGDEWVTVGSFPDGTPEEALELFTKKHLDLEAQVSLAEQRLRAGANAKDIQRSVEKLRTELATPSSVGDIHGLRARVEAVFEGLGPAMEKQKREREAAQTEALAQRESLVTAIEALAAVPAEKIRWKDTTAKVTELFAAWQDHQQNGPRLPKQAADDLWKRFRAARNTLDRERRAHFQERDKASKEAKSVKRALIEQAEALAPKGASGIPRYRELLEEWKKAPRAARAVDEALWAQFKAAGDALYQAKSEADQAEEESLRGNGEAKLALLESYQDIASATDHAAASARLRSFFDEFRKIGPVPKSMLKAVDQKVKALEAHVKKLQEQHWHDNNPEKKARSESFLDQLNDQIAALEGQIARAESAGDSSRLGDLRDELSAKMSWRDALVSKA